ncbi:MAG: hypothetical protein KZQ90_11560 [Candidatus Thiodiazotropha sp. (ex Codakia rugifera)]|nr:hypothetical protein [Candidatus Thiodiazotropha sp. (ex Codakia rugifera)]
MHTYILYGLLITLIVLVLVRCRQINRPPAGEPKQGIFYDIEINSEEKAGEFLDFIFEPEDPAVQILLRKSTKLTCAPPLKTTTSDIEPLEPREIEQIFIRYDNVLISFGDITCKLEHMKLNVDDFIDHGWFVATTRFTKGTEKIYDHELAGSQESESQKASPG